MSYAKLAIIIWIAITIIIAILAKRPVFKQFGVPQNSVGSPLWRAYLFCCAGLGGAIAIGLTFLIKSLAGSIA